jgi:hypothetical protein
MLTAVRSGNLMAAGEIVLGDRKDGVEDPCGAAGIVDPANVLKVAGSLKPRSAEGGAPQQRAGRSRLTLSSKGAGLAPDRRRPQPVIRTELLRGGRVADLELTESQAW